jgi:hypothetical protein
MWRVERRADVVLVWIRMDRGARGCEIWCVRGCCEYVDGQNSDRSIIRFRLVLLSGRGREVIVVDYLLGSIFH